MRAANLLYAALSEAANLLLMWKMTCFFLFVFFSAWPLFKACFALAFSHSAVKSELTKTGQAFVTAAFIIDWPNAVSPAVSHVDREPAPGPHALTRSYGGFWQIETNWVCDA